MKVMARKKIGGGTVVVLICFGLWICAWIVNALTSRSVSVTSIRYLSYHVDTNCEHLVRYMSDKPSGVHPDQITVRLKLTSENGMKANEQLFRELTSEKGWKRMDGPTSRIYTRKGWDGYTEYVNMFWGKERAINEIDYAKELTPLQMWSQRIGRLWIGVNTVSVYHSPQPRHSENRK